MSSSGSHPVPPPSWRERLSLRLVDCAARARADADPSPAILRAIAEETGISCAALRVAEGTALRLRAVAGPHPASFEAPLDTAESGVAGRVLRGDLPSFCSASSQEAEDTLLSAGWETYAIVPVGRAGERRGLLELADRRAGALAADDVAFLARLGESLGAALAPRDRERAAEREERGAGALAWLIDQLNVGFFVSTLEGRLEQANRATARAAGYDTVDELLAVPTPALYAQADDRSRFVDQLRRRGEVKDFLTTSVRKDGTHYPLSISAVVLRDAAGRPERIAGVIEDITERKRAEAETLFARQRQALYVDQTPLAVVEFDLSGRVTAWNPAAARLFGYAREEALGQHWTFIVPDSKRARLDGVWEGFVSAQGDTFVATENRTKRGDLISCEWYTTRLVDGDGKAVAVASLVMDVTERTSSEIALRRSEERHRTVSRLTSEYVFTMEIAADGSARLTGVTDSYTTATGRSLADAETPGDWAKFLHPEDADRVFAALRRMVDEGGTADLEARAYTTSGTLRFVRVVAEAVRAEQPPRTVAIVGAVSDLTEKKQLAEQLFQAQKMEAIGQLAGGVAHDFNNLLAGILASVSLVELRPELAPDVRAELGEVKRLVQRGADLSKQLLGFARRGKYDARPMDLGAAIERTAALFGRTRADVVLRVDPAADLAPVLADVTQMEQVFLNLFVNAGHAMPGGGVLSIRARNVALPAERAAVHRVAPGPYVEVAVADTGVGMDPETCARVFEPFFTTREVGHGTGLGLASVFGILQSHRGFVTVESELGKGSTFVAYLPATSEAVVEQQAAAEAPGRGVATILLVDDEPSLRRLIRQMLEQMGYRVLSAAGGAEAVDALRRHREQVSLVILDMTMPGMGGRATFDALRAVAPRVKVLLCSGYGIEGQATEIMECGCDAFLQKPFDMEGLSAKLRELL